jgi:hypothetical protein
MLYKMGLGLTNHRRISAAALPAGPSAFTVGAWSLTDAAVGGQATVTILSLPVDGGSGLTALQYRIGHIPGQLHRCRLCRRYFNARPRAGGQRHRQRRRQ